MEKTNRNASTIREIGIASLLLWTFALVLITLFAPAAKRTAYAVLIFATNVAVLIGFMSRTSLCMVLCGTLSCVWVSYRLYMFFVAGTIFHPVDYVMIVMPLWGMLSAILFEKGILGIDTENTSLRKQVDELVLVDEITGLFNLRALYKDLLMIISYSERRDLPISLMIIQMRYEQELNNMLTRRQYIKLCQALAKLVDGGVRLEDRTYAIDDKGTLAIILTTSSEDSAIVRKRLLNAIAANDTFDGILERGANLQLQIACKQYQKDYGEDMMRFKCDVENELVYDV